MVKKEEIKEEPQDQAHSSNSVEGSNRLEGCGHGNVKTIRKEKASMKDESQEEDRHRSSDSEWSDLDWIKYQKYKCPYCDWENSSWDLGHGHPPTRYQQRIHVLNEHFSEDIHTALLTMLECTGGPCSICGASLPIRQGGWDRENCNAKGLHTMRKEDYKMFTWHDKQILLHFVATKHELTLTEGLVFSNNKLNQKNVDLLLDKLFP